MKIVLAIIIFLVDALYIFLIFLILFLNTMQKAYKNTQVYFTMIN